MQLKTSKTIKFFHPIFKVKFGFEEYMDWNKPTVFFGIYRGNDIKDVERHRGVKIIWLAGYDASVKETLLAIKENPALKDAIIVAESRWIKEDLDAMGLKYENISLCMDNLYNWRPAPLGKSLFWYKAGESRYGRGYVQAVRKAFPDLDIITCEQSSVPREKMHEVYAQCFAGLRPIEHDGMSQSVAEMALMGRYTIWNGEGPFAVNFKGIEGIIEAIGRLKKADWNEKLLSKRSRGYFIENEKKWCDLVLRLCGTSELGVAGIFHESEGRCGSIFRIMRKEDVRKIGGLGTDQFERPWMSEQIKKIGKIQLITSKNSGFMAREFKSLKNKGYPQGVEYHTYDKKYE